MSIGWKKLLALVAVCTAAAMSTAQTRDRLREKYGPADGQGYYTIRPGVLVKPSYAEDGQVCKVAIIPKPLPPSEDSKALLMKAGMVAEIISDFAPEAKGGLNRPSRSMGGYVSVEEYDYKRVTAYVRSRQMPDGSKRISSAEVVWKARKCK
jgi:hypothetical protein